MSRYSVKAAQDKTGWEVRGEAEAEAAILIAKHSEARNCEYQYKVERMRLDFAWPKLKVAIEIDGPMHFAPYQAARDRLRDHRLRALGWLIFHIDADEPLEYGQVSEQLVRVLRLLKEIR